MDVKIKARLRFRENETSNSAIYKGVIVLEDKSRGIIPGKLYDVVMRPMLHGKSGYIVTSVREAADTLIFRTQGDTISVLLSGEVILQTTLPVNQAVVVKSVEDILQARLYEDEDSCLLNYQQIHAFTNRLSKEIATANVVVKQRTREALREAKKASPKQGIFQTIIKAIL